MSSFEEFMNEVKESPTKALLASNTTLPATQLALTTAVDGLLAPFSIPGSERQKFSEEVSSLVQDKAFLSEFSDQVGEPLEDESEDEFVERGSDKLRQMLYSKFNIRS
jgi:hypothetical protein